MEQALTPAITPHPLAVAAFVGYLAVMVAVGVAAARFSSAGIGEYFVAGRRMHRFLVALSAVVSGRSVWLLLGVTGMAYAMGAAAVWSVTGYIVAELLLFLFYGPRLRRFSEAYDCVTLPDFFAARFGDRRGVLRGALALVILAFMVGYVSAQFVGGGKAFAASFGIAPTTGMLVTAAIVLAYTVLGGFLAASITDTIQACFMIVALVAVPALAVAERGGLAAVLAELGATDASLLDPTALALGAAIGFLGIGLGSPGNPHIIVRYMAIRDPEQLRYAAVVGTVWNVVMAWGALFAGLVGRVYFPSAEMLPAGDAERLFPLLAQQHLPPVLFGVVVAAIFAAIMSTADSQLLVAASSVVRDFYQRILRRDTVISQRRLVGYSRAVVVLLVGAAVGVGLVAEELVFWLVLFAWAGLGAAIGPAAILALYWQGATHAGVLAGLLTGTAVTFLWKESEALAPLLYELIPAFAAALVVTVAVSWFTRPPPDAAQLLNAMEAPRPPERPRVRAAG